MEGLEGLTRPEIIELGQEHGQGVLHFPGSPSFEYELSHLHGEEAPLDIQMPGTTGASDRIATDIHAGTHVDSLSHIALDGRLCDGTDVLAPGAQSAKGGVRMNSGSGLRPIVAPGILLDLPGYLGCEVLEDGYAITVEDTLGCAAASGVEIEPGNVVLFRTGFDLHWDRDPERFVSAAFPGPEIEVARLLRERGAVATGSDTMTYEAYPSDNMLAIHVELLVEGGIFILECLRLHELAARGAHRFQFIALPLRMPRATGSPVNPVAVL